MMFLIKKWDSLTWFILVPYFHQHIVYPRCGKEGSIRWKAQQPDRCCCASFPGELITLAFFCKRNEACDLGMVGSVYKTGSCIGIPPEEAAAGLLPEPMSLFGAGGANRTSLPSSSESASLPTWNVAPPEFSPSSCWPSMLLVAFACHSWSKRPPSNRRVPSKFQEMARTKYSVWMWPVSTQW